ncbi:hypothetical protein N482_10755 [Pseudoalteromonas luteoviolacea NCIMB 1942]|uniref:TonB-dependent receptor n=2 Tax=Pseudoalteromonas luteoviolacea TaxID=43657 RepID=A0A167BZA8_9GAMM|nr:hypothetical protein N482_10755 [Pseudoalteromonas luteoviolacea NCIMB 1942]
MKNMRKNLLYGAIRVAIFGAAFGVVAQQQNTSASDLKSVQVTETKKVTKAVKEDEKIEHIVVTGSRLKRDSFSVTTPLVTLNRDAITESGLGSLSEILVDGIPALNAAISNTTSQSSVSTTGLSSISLRDLGSDRTLTLIDGRRVVSNSYSGNVVSLSTIPSGMVDRVEVISGGASATYGADAVAGVVNIITETGKEGVSLKARTGESFEGGVREFSLDLDYGTYFAEDKGYALLTTSWEREFGMTFFDRKRAQVEDAHRYDDELMCNQMLTVDGFQCMKDISQSDWASKNDGIPGGVFLENSRNDTQFWYDGQTLRDDWRGNEERFGINSNQYVMLKIPNDKFSIAGKIEYDLSDDLKAYGQVQLSINNAFNNKSPENESESDDVPIFDPITGDPAGDVEPGYIPIDNPFVPQAIIDSEPYRDRIYWDRRFNEVGNISTDNTRTTIRSWAGLQGTVFDGEWDWDMSVGYGKFHQEQIRLNELNVVNVNQALQAEKLADGTIQCKDAAAREAGCVPLNLFGEGSITPEMANWIRTNPTLNTYIEQVNFLAYMTGELFELPAGHVSAVFGGEYRKDTQEIKTSRDMQVGGITWNVVPQFKGDMSVFEAFAEFDVPLLKNKPFAKSLSLETSLRLANYDIDAIGTVASYKIGFLWQPIDNYFVRANFARAQRAPTITELMSPPRGDFDSFSDICDSVTATSTDPGHDMCRLDPNIAALLAADPDFEFEDESSSKYSPNTGNPELREETADTFTFGITMTPVEGLSLAVDYIDISVIDAISEISNSRILDECYNSSTPFGNDNAFCQEITRNEDGQITKVLQRQFNLDELRYKGIDVALEYNYDLSDLGELTFKADHNHIIESSETFLGNDGLVTDDNAGYGMSKDKLSASLRWKYESWRVRWRTKYLGKFTASLSDEREYEEMLADNAERCASGELDSGCIENPEPLEFNDYGSYIRHDLSVSYNTELDGGYDLKVYGGINNLFDNLGPFYPSGRGNFYSGYGGGKGRFGYVGVELKF